ncbi:MAG: hypothetical protein RLZZ157_528 [Pseudomonadota bacterium]|jgi:nucleotide-binding universal stress UspA family protein
MAQRQLLVPLSGQADDMALLQQGLALANLCDGAVMALLAQSDPNDVMIWATEGAFAVSHSLVESVWTGANDTWAKVQDSMAGLIAVNSSLRLERAIGATDQILAKYAALSEVTLVSAATARGKALLSPAFEALLLGAGAPILIARATPDAIAGAVGRGIMIAWNGAGECARAVKAALPFLRVTQRVTVAQVTHPDIDPEIAFASADYLVEYLKNLGIAGAPLILTAKDAPEALIQAATAHDVGLLVAGAWGHSRAREFIFGGATRTFLKDDAGPSLLLCH